ncbi:hypothetical protein [Chryseobacterium defluvii]|uniref:Uncharacterized protein n=1 Tax=Chryseobacterium defluvii TaxID=160396 RepID=A0A495SDB9_9FLAO|nr:hypothetical protein [Chryseobacterium defluvii]RKS98177.1 hypothetical protein BCF58_2317 [Chryseobacterium defluvii]
MKTTALIMLGFLCLSFSTACKCEPEDEETTDPKESSARNNINDKSSGKTENDTVFIKR